MKHLTFKSLKPFHLANRNIFEFFCFLLPKFFFKVMCPLTCRGMKIQEKVTFIRKKLGNIFGEKVTLLGQKLHFSGD